MGVGQMGFGDDEIVTLDLIRTITAMNRNEQTMMMSLRLVMEFWVLGLLILPLGMENRMRKRK